VDGAHASQMIRDASMSLMGLLPDAAETTQNAR